MLKTFAKDRFLRSERYHVSLQYASNNHSHMKYHNVTSMIPKRTYKKSYMQFQFNSKHSHLIHYLVNDFTKTFKNKTAFLKTVNSKNCVSPF